MCQFLMKKYKEGNAEWRKANNNTGFNQNNQISKKRKNNYKSYL